MKPSDEKDLNAYLGRIKLVNAKDREGREWGFEIKRVPLESWDPDGSWYRKLLPEPHEFAARLSKEVESPPQEAIRRVLLRGVRRPRVSDHEGSGAVLVDDLLRDDVLVRSLYSEIAAFSVENFLAKAPAEGANDGRTPADVKSR